MIGSPWMLYQTPLAVRCEGMVCLVSKGGRVHLERNIPWPYTMHEFYLKTDALMGDVDVDVGIQPDPVV